MEAALIYAMKTPQIVVDIEMAKRAAAAKKVSLKQASRRNQSKLNQRRYRADQKRATDLLNQAVNQLRTDVARLEGRVETMRLAVPPPLRTFERECNVAEEYIRHFAHGYNLDATSAQHKIQVDFLANAMSPDLVVMGGVGSCKLLEQWELYMNTFEEFSMELHSIQVVSFAPNVNVHVNTTLHLRMSCKSVHLLFPHANDDTVTRRLVGKVLRVPVQQRFIFDHNGIVQELGTSANTTFALVNALGSLEDTLAVVKDFRLTESAEIAVAQ